MDARDSDRLYYLTDANNNVTAVTNSSGVVQERYSYDAFGKATMYDATWGDQQPHPARATRGSLPASSRTPRPAWIMTVPRWYNPSTGGFISQDPAQSDRESVSLCRE